MMPDLGDFNERDFKREMLGCLGNLRAFAMSLSGRSDIADDLVQDTILKAWANKTRFQPGTNMKAWLFTILRNQFFSQIRKRRREVQDSDGVLSAQLSTPPNQHGVVDLNDMRIALEKLPPDQREALLLVGPSGFSYEEAAEICGCAIGTIKSRVNRGRARLMDLLSVGDDSDYGPDARSLAVSARSVQG